MQSLWVVAKPKFLNWKSSWNSKFHCISKTISPANFDSNQRKDTNHLFVIDFSPEQFHVQFLILIFYFKTKFENKLSKVVCSFFISPFMYPAVKLHELLYT